MSTFHYENKIANFISALTFNPIDATHAPFYVDDNGMYGIRWTLNYEMYFYVVMSFMLLFNRRWLATVLFFFTSLVLVPIYFWGEWTTNPDGYQTTSAIAGLITNPVILLFLTGMALGIILPVLQMIPSTASVVFLVISLLMTVYYFSNGQYAAHGLISSGWLYALILIFTVLSEPIIGKLIPDFLTKLGNISYSLYLIHPLMNNGIGKRFEDIGIDPGLLRITISVVISVILAWCSWRFIETRFCRVISPEIRR